MFMYWEAPMFRVKNHVHVQGKHPTDLSHSAHTTPRQFRPPHLSHLGISHAGRSAVLFVSITTSEPLLSQCVPSCLPDGPALLRAWGVAVVLPKSHSCVGEALQVQGASRTR